MSEIRWKHAVDGKFGKPSKWKGAVVPGADDDAILRPAGQAFTVTADQGETVSSLQTGANATLVVTSNPHHAIVFTATNGTGSGRNAGTISVQQNATLLIDGEMDNTGVIALRSKREQTILKIGDSGVTLTGGGVVSLADDGDKDRQIIKGTSATSILVNVDNTITGSGGIGDSINEMSLINESKGVIDAVGAYGLYIRINDGITNAGTIEKSGGSRMNLESSVDNTGGVIRSIGGGILAVQGSVVTGGVIQATADGVVEIDCTLVGVTLRTSAGGVNQTNGHAEFDGSTAAVVNTGRFLEDAYLDLRGQIINSGEIDVDGIVTLDGANMTLSGGGAVNLGDSGRSVVKSGPASETLVNVDNTIAGAGRLGQRRLILDNESAGVIDANKGASLIIDTGANAIINAGIIEASGTGGGIVASAVINSGVLEAAGGDLTFEGAVSGAGSAIVSGGVLAFDGAFTEDVAFAGEHGDLRLGQSQTYAGAISGLVVGGTSTLDLRDIGFVGASQATFSGTATSGVLTVTDGTHTANITLVGDYLDAVFTTSADDHGGTVVAASAGPGAQPPHAFISAMAALGASAAHAIQPREAWSVRVPALAGPRAMAA